MRRLWLPVLLLVSLPITGRGDVRQRDVGASSAAALQLVKVWRQAVEDHQPGEPDDPAYAVAAWSSGVVEEVAPYIEAFLQLVAAPAMRTVDHPARRFTIFEIEHLRELASGDATTGADVALRKRAALLHSDIAMLVRPAPRRFPASPAGTQPVRARTGKGSGRLVVRAPDGDYRGLEYSDVHFELARRLLDRVATEPSHTAMVRLWYRATAAYFAESHMFAELTPHLERGLQLFASDPHLLFAQGCLNETLATPGVQAFVAATLLPGNLRLNVDSAHAHLRRAGESFVRVSELNPSATEPRIRLARVLAGLDRHADAAALLRATVERLADPVLTYYAQLFLGDVERALGRDQQSREAFEAAARLFPRAQTPRLALSQLARRHDDAAGATALLTFLTTTTDVSQEDDPWWAYDRGEGRYVADLLEELWELFRR